MMDKDDIVDILDGISKGNTSSFTVFYNTYGKDLLKYVVKKVDHIEIAEDIVHDLFLSIWKNKHKIHEISNIKAYLYSGARYLTIAYYNKNSETKHHIDIADIDISLNETAIEDRLHYRYLLDLLHEEIENLPEKCKLIFKESRINHKTINQIAQEYNISESTVENHINKALKVLKRTSKHYLTVLPFFL